MNRISTFCDKSVVAVPCSNQTLTSLAAGANGVDVFPDMRQSVYGSTGTEIASRWIQNVGANNAFFAIDQDCNGGAYHGVLPTGMLPMDISAFGCGRINVYSTGATIISTITIRRVNAQDLGQNIIRGGNTSKQ